MQVTPTPVKHTNTKFARPKAKKASKPNSLPEDNVVSEKEMRLAIQALLLQSFLNMKMKEWGELAIKVASNLNMERQMLIHIIKDFVNDKNGKAQEGLKELEASWEGHNSSI